MTDKLFKFYTPESLPNDKSSYSHFGWEHGITAWSTMLEGYKKALDALYNLFLDSQGQFAVIDTIIYPFCFISRQIMELSVKWLYLKYSGSTEKAVKDFLNKNHNLYDTWFLLKPVLKKLKKQVITNVSIGELEEYILDMNEFDTTSMKMRYPIDKDLQPMNTVKWIDVTTLYNGTKDFYNKVEQLNYDLSRRVDLSDNDCEKIKEFVIKYREKKRNIESFLTAISTHKDDKEEGLINKIIYAKKNPVLDVLNNVDDDTKIVLECLYYSGRSIKCDINLPPAKGLQPYAVATLCIRQMEDDKLQFGVNLQEGQINVYGKQPSSILTFCKVSMDLLDKFDLNKC